VLAISIIKAMMMEAASTNISKLLPDYTAQQTKRQPSSYLPPTEPEISPGNEPLGFTKGGVLLEKLNMLLASKVLLKVNKANA
jgi:hypothetical protein